MTAPTDHLAAARAALAFVDATSSSVAVDRALARAQVHATLALAEEARTTNLIALAALEFAPGNENRQQLISDARLDEITARLWGTT